MVEQNMKTLGVDRREGNVWVVSATHGADEQARPEPFQEVPFDIAALWRVPGR